MNGTRLIEKISSGTGFIVIAVFILYSFIARAIVSGTSQVYYLLIFISGAILLLKDKKSILYIFLIYLPFSSSLFLTQNIMNIPGVKPFNLLAGLLLVISFVNSKKNYDLNFKIKVQLFLIIYFLVFSIAILRSLQYLPTIHVIFPEKFHSSPIRYLLSFYMKPSLYLVSFIFIIFNVNSVDDIFRVVRIICFSILLVSIFILFQAGLNIPYVGDLRTMAKIWADYLGVHYNTLASHYVICIPLILYLALKKSKLGIVTTILALPSVAILQSRAAYATIIMAVLLYLAFTKRAKYNVVFALAVFLLFSYSLIPDFVYKRVMLGIKERDIHKISAGRVTTIWRPLLAERLESPYSSLFGVGRYSMMVAPSYLKRQIHQAGHPHNAILEMFLDSGGIVTAFFLVFAFVFLKKAFSLAKQFNSDLFWALITSILAYLIVTMSGRSFFPHRENCFLFPIIGLLIAYLKVRKAQPLN